MVVVAVVAWAFVSVVAVALAASAMPVEVRLHVDTTATPPVRARLRLLLGLVNVQLPGDGAASRRAKTAPHRPQRPRSRHRPSLRQAWRFALAPGMLRRLGRFVGDALHCVSLRDVHIVAVIGIDDPADTGMLWGAVAPMWQAVVRRAPGVVVVPDFEGAGFDASGTATVRVVPLDVIGAALRLVLSPTTISAAWRVWAPAGARQSNAGGAAASTAAGTRAAAQWRWRAIT